MICSRFPVLRDVSQPCCTKVDSVSPYCSFSVSGVGHWFLSSQVHFEVHCWNRCVFLKAIGIIYLTPELNLQQVLLPNLCDHFQTETKRTVTSLRKREGSERIPASGGTTGMSYSLSVCFSVSSKKKHTNDTYLLSHLIILRLMNAKGYN